MKQCNARHASEPAIDIPASEAYADKQFNWYVSMNPQKGTLMKQQGAAQVVTTMGLVWCHYSREDDTIKLRRYSAGNIFDVDVASVDIVNIVSLTECKKYVKSDSYSYNNIEVWVNILRMLDTNVKPSAGSLLAPKNKEQTPTKIVPITLLRKIYASLHLFDTNTMVALADFFAAHPKSLERLWNKSRSAFEGYDNRKENWGSCARKELPAAPSSATQISKTTEFTAYIKQSKDYLNKLGYSFVERELSPWRTTNAAFSNKLPATKSGTGGIDVLLKNEKTKMPAVGEVKIGGDKNAFFALIQAMTYAVELSTPSQLVRLSQYSNFTELDAKNGRVEIVLFMVNHAKDKTLKPVRALIEKLNHSPNKYRGLGTVVLV
jgi:hypothetical protein